MGVVESVLRLLRNYGENHDISIIDEKAHVVQKLAETHDVLGVIGNGASYSILSDAGVETADIIIAVTNSDELNLYVV